jgi:hypothetical protein
VKGGDREDESGERVVISTHCGQMLMRVRCGPSKWSLERYSPLTELQTWIEEKGNGFKQQRAHMNLIKPFYCTMSELQSKGDGSSTRKRTTRS